MLLMAVGVLAVVLVSRLLGADWNATVTLAAAFVSLYAAILAVEATRQGAAIAEGVKDVRDMIYAERLLALWRPLWEWDFVLRHVTAEDLLQGRRSAKLKEFSRAMNQLQPRLSPLTACETLRATASQTIAGGAGRVGQERELVSAAINDVGDALWGPNGSARPRD